MFKRLQAPSHEVLCKSLLNLLKWYFCFMHLVFLATRLVGSHTELELPALEGEVLTTDLQGSPCEMLVSHKIGLVLEKEMAAHSSILAWRIPWTEEPGGLQSVGSQESDMTED